MFDGGGAGGFDMSDLLAQAQAMQNQLMEAQANLESQEIEGSAGGGLVTALVSGTGELLSLDIKPEAVDPDDTETLADLIVAAVRDASENAKQAAAAAMGPLAGGIPGFGSEGQSGFGGGSSAPAGFSLPGASAAPGITGGDKTDESGSGSSAGDTGESGSTGTGRSGPSAGSTGAGPSASGSSPSGPGAGGASAGGAGGSGGGVGFVNPGGGAGVSGRNSG